MGLNAAGAAWAGFLLMGVFGTTEVMPLLQSICPAGALAHYLAEGWTELFATEERGAGSYSG